MRIICSATQQADAGCWISTSKSFEICASEFSILQSGNFNTAQSEKEIIVIDTMYWRNNQPSYKNNGCYSVFTDQNGKTLVDLGDESAYPSTTVNTTKSRNSYINWGIPYNGKTVNRDDLMEQLKSFRQKINTSAQTGILDMSFPTADDRSYTKTGSKLAPIQEFSLMDYVKQELIPNHFPGLPIASGQAKGMQEVLILNQIPFNAIKIKLSKLEKISFMHLAMPNGRRCWTI